MKKCGRDGRAPRVRARRRSLAYAEVLLQRGECCVVVRFVLDFADQFRRERTLSFSSITTTARAVRPVSGPLVTSTPYACANSWPRNASRPSRRSRCLRSCKSATPRTAGRPTRRSRPCCSSFAAASLNLRVDVAQVGVSRLGTMFSTLRLPREIGERQRLQILADQRESRRGLAGRRESCRLLRSGYHPA